MKPKVLPSKVVPKNTEPTLNNNLQSFFGKVSSGFDNLFQHSSTTPFRVLCLDGGGMRGIGTAELLRVLAAHIKKSQDKELYQFFDLIVGTSTGGILAGASAMGVPSEDFVSIYFKDGERIFNKKIGGGVIGSKFSKEGLKEVIKERVPGAENLTLKDAKTGLAVTSYEPKHFKTRLFTNETVKETERLDFFNKRFVPGGHIPVIKAIRMTSAAPSYFKGVNLCEGVCYQKPEEGTKHAFIDGGLGANNPSALTYDYVKQLKDQGSIAKDRKLQFVSFGTGSYQGEDFTRDAGIIKFLYEDGVLHAIDGGQLPAIESFEDRIRRAERKNQADYFRINFDLSGEVDLATTDPIILQEMVDSANKATRTSDYQHMLDVLLK